MINLFTIASLYGYPIMAQNVIMCFLFKRSVIKIILNI